MKKILLLACSPGNIKVILDKTSFHKWEFPYKFTADLCAINKICGIGSHTSKFPCYLCIWSEKDGAQKGARKHSLKSLKGTFFYILCYRECT